MHAFFMKVPKENSLWTFSKQKILYEFIQEVYPHFFF